MRLRRTGSTDDPLPRPSRDRGPCLVAGCTGIDYRRGYCTRHYERLKRYGDPLIEKRQRNNDPPEHCTVDGCQAPHHGKGLCRRHYSQANHVANRPERNARMRDHYRADPATYSVRSARRRRGMARGMDALDRALSDAYRQAIAADPCTYCGAAGVHNDHLFPVALGGTDHWWNLVRACELCNKRKAAHCGTWFRLRASLPAVA